MSPSQFLPRRPALLAVLLCAFTSGAAQAAPGPVPASTTVPDSALAVYDGGTVFPREFTRAWWALSPDQYPPGDGLKSRITFLAQIVDRKLLEREVKRRHYALTDAETQDIAHTRDVLIQNALFDEIMRDVPEPTPAELEAFKRQQLTLAEVRIVTFADLEKARSWRQRLATGTPVSSLDAAIKREGPALAVADTFRYVAAEQIPDTVASVIWAMRPGQASEVHTFGGEPAIILVRSFAPRPSRVRDEPSALRMEYQRRLYNRARERYRVELATRLQRTFDDEAMNLLLRAHLQLPPRNDVDTLTGTPMMRANIQLPAIAPADTGRVLARSRDGVVTIGGYLTYWDRVQPYARPEVRERASLEGAVDRIALSGEILRLGLERKLDQNPAIVEQVEHRRTGFEVDHYFHDEIESKVKVTDAALRSFWAKDPDHYNDRASLESHIILLDRKSQADSLLAQIRNGASFSELARTYSMDGRTGAQGGQVGRQYRGTQENVGLEDAMFATPIGGLGGPEKTPQGWVIWRIDTATAGVKRTFEQARDMVERDYRILEADRILKEKLAALRQAAHVKIFEDRVTLDLGKGGPWDE
jgi:hypothetical protein